MPQYGNANRAWLSPRRADTFVAKEGIKNYVEAQSARNEYPYHPRTSASGNPGGEPL